MKNLNNLLQELLSNTDSEAVVLANSDGLPLAAINIEDENRIAALTASLQSMTDRFVENFKRNNSKQIIVETADGYITIKRVNENLVLMLLSGNEAKLGMILLYLDDAVKQLDKMFEQ